MGGTKFDPITIGSVYSFDTLDTLKQLISRKLKNQDKAARYLPKFLFVGIPKGSNYLPLDYNWVAPGSANPNQAIQLPSPLVSVGKNIPEFTTRSGAFPPLSSMPRGRTILEDVFPLLEIPELFVFPLHTMLSGWQGVTPLSEGDWNSHFAAYFPLIPLKGPYTASESDIAFGKTMYSHLETRLKRLQTINEYLESGEPLPPINVTGVYQLKLQLQKLKGQFDGCESLFYRVPVTDRRPFTRLLPTGASPITKVLVKGVIPIPAQDNPEVITQWSKETAPIIGQDYLTVKYVHRDAVGTIPPIYGTIGINADGTANLLLQPPKNVKRLDPYTDFRNFGPILKEVLDVFPYRPADFQLKEVALQFQLIKEASAPAITRTKLRQRLKFFSSFFQEIGVPEKAAFVQPPILALRFKAVSSYATQDRIFAYISQYATAKSVEGAGVDPKLLQNLQEEFDLNPREAEQKFIQWLKERDPVTLAVPETGEFIESYNAGTDIYVYRQPPNYKFEVFRIDSYSSFQLIYSLLGMLFSDEEGLFTVSDVAAATFQKQESALETSALAEEAGETKKPTAFSRGSVAATALATASSVATATATAMPASRIIASSVANAAMEDLLEDEEEEEEGEAPSITTGDGKSYTPATLPAASIAIASASSAAVKPSTKSIAKPVAKPTAKAVASATSKLVADADEERLINPSGWFLQKLQELDNSLFGYVADPPGSDNYGRMCAAQAGRHPVGLRKDQMDRMIEEYEPEVESGKVFFSIYPLGPDDEEYDPPPRAYNVSITRYGSDPLSQNHYFCPALFCLYDYIMILESDFAGTKWRPSSGKTGPKPPDSCPFCGGKLIGEKQKKPILGYTVVRRKLKPSGTEAHLHIGFLRSSTHPEKDDLGNRYALPCCFVPPKILSITDKEYHRFKTEARAVSAKKSKALLAAEEGELEEDEELEDEEEELEGELEDEEAASVAGTVVSAAVSRTMKASQHAAIPYSVYFEQIAHRDTYVLLADKHPIDEPGKIAILPAPFDKYFNQNSENIIIKEAIRRQVRAASDGFLRIGTEIGRLERVEGGSGTQPTEALLGVLAPLLLQHSIEEVRKRIEEKVTVPMFVAANFGNLVNEFYNPTDPVEIYIKDQGNFMDNMDSPVVTTYLKSWAADHLNMPIDDNIYAIRRIHNSYNRFIEFLNDKTQKKEIRHFSSFLAEPGILTRNGLQLIVLEWDPPSGKEEVASENVKVRCMPYGYSADRHENTDFAFVWRDGRGYYELMVHTHNEPKKGAKVAVHEYEIRWKRENEASWPPIVTQRINEFTTQCVSNYRTVYTPQRGVDSLAMVPLSQAVLKIKRQAAGLVRDAYNHAVCVLYPLKAGKLTRDSALVAIPIVDDGWIPRMDNKYNVYLDMENFTPAPVDLLIAYYKANLEDIFSLYEGYQVKNVVVRRADKKVCAIQLANDLFIRAAAPSKGTDIAGLGYPVIEVDRMEWTINTELSKPCGSEADIRMESTTAKMEELYQQYRYMFSNWIAGPKAATGRTLLQEILFQGGLPDYEKRKRLEIVFGSLLRRWLVPDAEPWELPETFLRKDCRVLDEASCTGSCAWKKAEGRCGLHVDAMVTIGTDKKVDRVVSTPNLFSYRLMDELIRFPQRRKELRSLGVKKLRAITGPIRTGDQYIIPENSTTWINLLRMDWMPKDVPKFYEEMASETGPEEPVKGPSLPADLAALLGPNPYKLWTAKDDASLAKVLSVPLTDLDIEPGTVAIPRAALEAYVDLAGTSVGIVDPATGSISFVRAKENQDRAIVIVYLADGFGLLTEKPGSPYVSVERMPATLLNKWDTVKTVKLVRKKVAPASLVSVTKASTVPTLVGTTVPSELETTASVSTLVGTTKPESAVPLSKVGDLFVETKESEESAAPSLKASVAPPPSVSSTVPASAKLVRKKPKALSTIQEASEKASLELLPSVAKVASVSSTYKPIGLEPLASLKQSVTPSVTPLSSATPSKSVKTISEPVTSKAASLSLTPEASIKASLSLPPPPAVSIKASTPKSAPTLESALAQSLSVKPQSTVVTVEPAAPSSKPPNVKQSVKPSLSLIPPPKSLLPSVKPSTIPISVKPATLSVKAPILPPEEEDEELLALPNDEEEAPATKPVSKPASKPATVQRSRANSGNSVGSENYLKAFD